MPRITVDNTPIECRPGIPVLLAALEAGWDVPHYCYHPGLSVVASCRLCLMEMKMPDPRTNELSWAPRLFPSCQTPVKDGMEVRFDSPKVRDNQAHCMEYFLLNHPLDCPVCDKAGECSLQDYSERFGHATSRMVEEKYKNPKKDIGPRTLLYQDRCVLCTRCVRFTQEVAGTSELTVVNRGSRSEIDVFPGCPLDNGLQGNVVDLCPVGCLLDKDFLFQQRVWFLKSADSVCPGCAAGCTIRVDQNENRVHRLKPRFNEKVNQWWMCDEGRFGWKYVHRPDRLTSPMIRRSGELVPTDWQELPRWIRQRLGSAAEDGSAAFVLSPMLACEEAWLLATFARSVAPSAVLVVGHVPRVGQDQTFKSGFTILAEKCPNRRGVERVIESFGGATLTFPDFLTRAAEGAFRFAFVTAGYPDAWLSDAAEKALAKVETLLLHDLFPSQAVRHAAAVIPGCAWVERQGSFVNAGGLVQPFHRAIAPLASVKRDGQFFMELAGQSGLYRADAVRAAMSPTLPEFASVFNPRPAPDHAH